MNEVDILEKLVSFNTIKDKENKKIMDYIEKYCGKFGFDTIYKDKILVLSNAKNEKPGIVFLGHTDTVDAKDWNYDIFKLTKVGSKLIGLGTCDMKGGIACVMQAIAEIDFSKLSKKMMLIFTYDEEIGFGGIKDVIEKKLDLPERAIIGEPTNNIIYLGSKGLLEYKVNFFGKKAHSSMPFKGKNAIYEAINFIQELKEFYEIKIKKDLDESFGVPYTTFNVGVINGGMGMNSVADNCEIQFDFRTINKNETVIVEFVESLSKKYNAKLEEVTRIGAFKCTSSLIEKVETAPFITEASFISGERIILGPGPVNPHEKDEYVEIDSLKKCTKQYIEIIEKTCK